MKQTNNAEAALAQPDTKAVTFEMTPELGEKLSSVCDDVVDLLRRRTKSPMEAYMALQFCMHAIEEMTGIRGGIILENDDNKH